MTQEVVSRSLKWKCRVVCSCGYLEPRAWEQFWAQAFFLIQFVGAVGRLDVGFDISLQRFLLTLFFSCARLLEFSLMIPAVALEGAV